jgi:hypothetical protein
VIYPAIGVRWPKIYPFKFALAAWRLRKPVEII